MKMVAKGGILLGVIAAAAAAVMLKSHSPPIPAAVTASSAPRSLPRLVDLGSHSCMACKRMLPILDELRTGYEGRFQVDFIDVWADPGQSARYRIRLIPTQIFYDAAGKELFRHEGFFPKEDILAKWKEVGVELGRASATEPGAGAK
ncbi:MAG: thioredoxin family protein [Phycisphaerae bacterium]